ncbi:MULTISPECIES: hypothetical protein [Bacillus cereus group]|jgi:hypothetical protein|nr:hypothetical protein [Bacillus cereus]
MRERENWDVLCEVCDKTIERGVATESLKERFMGIFIFLTTLKIFF